MTTVNLAKNLRVFDARQITSAISPLFGKVKEGHIREALAVAAGYKSNAARLAAVTPALPFNFAVFGEHLGKLHPDKNGTLATAYSIASLLEGAVISIEINKHPTEKFERYTHVQYEVVVQLMLNDGSPAAHDFILPEFYVQAGVPPREFEPYRVDSWNSNLSSRAEVHRLTRRHSDKTLFAKFVKGEWRGELFVYGPAHQENDASCIKAVTSAIARAVLPGCTGGVHCEIYRPKKYDYGVWRVELSLGKSLSSYFAGGNLLFKLPDLENRFFIPDPGYRSANALIDELKFIDGKCFLDVTSNGIAEATNPSKIPVVRQALLNAVHSSASAAGWLN